MVKEGFLFSISTIIYLISFLLSSIGVLLRVAFFTLIERKIIGLIHYRKGPNKVVIAGVSQPIRDALKLLSKEFSKLSFIKEVIFMIGPTLGLILMVICWQWFSYSFDSIRKSRFSLLIIFRVIRISAFIFILTGWGSNTKYSLIGSYRAIAQVISYEVCLILYVLFIIYLRGSFKINQISRIQQNYWMCLINLPLFITWIILCIAESNRTPFDHAERESELVSGFNVEYGGGMFALIFIAEYGIIMFLRFLTTLLFLGGGLILIKTIIVCFIFVWVRCSFPRLRYDKLIISCWKICLPYRLGVLRLTIFI